jgi:hypothetical protein
MTDLGDDAANAGSQLTRSSLRYFLREVERRRVQRQNNSQHNTATQTPVSEAPTTETPVANTPVTDAANNQLEYLRSLAGPELSKQLDFDNLSQEDITKLIQAFENHDMVYVMPNVDFRDNMAQFAEEYNPEIQFDCPETASNVIIFKEADVERLKNSAEKVEADLSRALGEEPYNAKEVVRQEMQEAESSLQKEDPIKSHDGMDIDSRTGVVETSGYSWKEDLAERAALAREGAVEEAQLVKQCREHGITLERTADGKELLYRDAQKPWHNLRGDTLGERYSINSLQRSLEHHASRLREISRETERVAEMPNLDHTIPTR